MPLKLASFSENEDEDFMCTLTCNSGQDIGKDTNHGTILVVLKSDHPSIGRVFGEDSL
jgi:hypothetical protein